jgi:branched-subunit amino acid aminotransferase/4-amino-4-deoxychorismate lyase
MSLAYIDQKIVPLAEAKIKLDDNGYLLGDGVFETMRTTRSGSLFRPELHVARALAGLEKLLLPTDTIHDQFMDIAERLTSEAVKQLGSELYVRINISSGASRNWAATPTLVMTGIAKPLHAEKSEPLECITWDHHGQLHELSDVKSLSYARSALLRRKVALEKVDDIILISPEGSVVESSVSNVVARKGDLVYAPGTSAGALPGTTQHILVCELLPRDTYVVKEALTQDELYEADEVMLTSSLSGVKRVERIDNHAYTSTELYQYLSKKYDKLLD